MRKHFKATLAAFGLVGSSLAHAAADTLTGIDFDADIVQPVITSQKGAMTAAIGIFVLMLGFGLALRMVKKGSGGR